MKNWIRPAPEPGDRVVKLDDFPIYKQQTDHTCGPTALRMALEHLGLPESEESLARSCLTMPWGAFHYPVLRAYSARLKRIGKSALISGDDPAVFERIAAHLAAGFPVPFIFVTEDHFHPGKTVLHYGVVVGVDGPCRKILVANPFGVLEEKDLDQWWREFSLEPELITPLIRFLVVSGLLKPRTCFLVRDL